MKTLVVATIACLFGASVATAAAYDDFARGVNANMRGDSDAAIAAFDAALAAPDLTPSQIPDALRGRALAHLRKKDCSAALVDLEAARQMRPDDVKLIWLHASVATCLKQFDRALADYTALAATTNDGLAARGRLYWRLADYNAAIADFSAALERDRYDWPSLLWLDVARVRANRLDPEVAGQEIDKLSLDDWLRTLFGLFAGRVKPERVAADASEGLYADIKTCQADFYVAEWYLGHGDAAAAHALLEHAVTHCPDGRLEKDLAQTELERLQ